MPTTQWSVNELQASASRRIECSRLWIMTGLKTFSSKFPCEPADVVGDLHERTGQGPQSAAGGDQGVVGGQGGELVRGRNEGQAGQLGDPGGDLVGEAGRGVEAGADGRATEGELVQVGQGGV